MGFNFINAWEWLEGHPINNRPEPKLSINPQNVGMFELDIHVVKVSPKTSRIENDQTLNTKTEIWLEFGPFTNYGIEDPEYHRSHDPKLDCGGDTFEKAIVSLANLVKEYYGDYKK